MEAETGEFLGALRPAGLVYIAVNSKNAVLGKD